MHNPVQPRDARALGVEVHHAVHAVDEGLDLSREAPTEHRRSKEDRVRRRHPPEKGVGVVADAAQFDGPPRAGHALAATLHAVVEDIGGIHVVAIGPELILDPAQDLGCVALSPGAAQNRHDPHGSTLQANSSRSPVTTNYSATLPNSSTMAAFNRGSVPRPTLVAVGS
jgi:hypothetical protein